MHSSTLKFTLLGALAARGIITSPVQHAERSDDLDVFNIPPPPVEESHLDQRDTANVKRGGLKVVEIHPEGYENHQTLAKRDDLEARAYPYKTKSCGINAGVFMPLVAKDNREYGFNDAVSSFCSHVDGLVIPGGGMVAALVQSTGGELLRLTTGSIGHFQGVIVCRLNYVCTIAAATCIEYLKAIGADGSRCYGSKNKDTNGGMNDMDNSYWEATPRKGETA